MLLAASSVGAPGCFPIIGNLLHHGSRQARPVLAVGGFLRGYTASCAHMRRDSRLESGVLGLAHVISPNLGGTGTTVVPVEGNNKR